jgi:hypothetical protein
MAVPGMRVGLATENEQYTVTDRGVSWRPIVPLNPLCVRTTFPSLTHATTALLSSWIDQFWE